MQITLEELRQLASNGHGEAPAACEPSTRATPLPKYCGIQIVVLHRGWVVVGRVTRTADEVVIEQASVVRKWGTTKGIGEIATNGPTKDTVIDAAGTVRAHPLAIVLAIDCTAAKWEGRL